MRGVTSLWPKWNNTHSKLLGNKKQEVFFIICLFVCLFSTLLECFPLHVNHWIVEIDSLWIFPSYVCWDTGSLQERQSSCL